MAGDYPGNIVDMTDEEWDLTMAVNVRGPMTGSVIAARAMMADGSAGSIVNISSIRGTHPLPGKGPYNTSKAALNRTTRVMALELGPHGIRVNAVAPGTVATNRVRLGEQEAAHARGMATLEDSECLLTMCLEEVPLGRVAQPKDSRRRSRSCFPQ